MIARRDRVRRHGRHRGAGHPPPPARPPRDPRAGRGGGGRRPDRAGPRPPGRPAGHRPGRTPRPASAPRPTARSRLDGADLVVDNSGDRRPPRAEVDRVWAELARPAGSGSAAGPRRRDPSRDRTGTIGRVPDFEVVSPFRPAGDQPTAIAGLVEGVERGDRYQTLLGITGIGQDGHHRLDDRAGPAADPDHRAQQVAGRPAGRRAAGALPQEPGRVLRLLLRLLPARGLPARRRTPTSRRTRPSTTRSTGCATPRTSSLLLRRDVIVVASVSCIYGLGSPDEYRDRILALHAGRAATTSGPCCAGWSTCSTPATTPTWSAATSGPGATPSRSTPPTRSRPCASSSSATPSSASGPSTC